MESKAPYRILIDEAFPNDERLQRIATQEMGYTMNCVGGRPSDVAATACMWLHRALEAEDPSLLSSPTAKTMLTDYLADH